MPTYPIKLYSKSSVERDWKCPRSYYWAYEYDGKGIQSQSYGLELMLGSAIHDALAVLALKTKAGEAIDIDLIATTAYQQVFDSLPKPEDSTPLDLTKVEFAKEQATLIEGLIRGFYKHVWPKLMAKYRIASVELPTIHRHGRNLGMVAKPDLILQDQGDDSLWYYEYKTTSSKKDEWIKSWEYAIQLHSSIRAVEQTTGNSIDGVIIQGLYKGYRSYDKQGSPFCYAYKKNGNPPFTKDQIAYEYKSGFFRVPTWELEGGVKGWVESMPSNVLADQFPQTAPIFVNDFLIDAFFKQQELRQRDIVAVSEYLRGGEGTPEGIQEAINDVFPQRFDQCRPSFGYECPYLKLCHSNAGENPLENGFVYRTLDHMQDFLDLLTPEERGNA